MVGGTLVLGVTLGDRGQGPQGLWLGLGPEDPRWALRLQARGAGGAACGMEGARGPGQRLE